MEYPQEYRYRGFELEEACLGHKIDWSTILRKNNISTENLTTRKDWERIIQELYPDDPTMPKQKWGKDLYNFVADKLNLDLEEPQGLCFYNSLGSVLDKMGIDCFFTYKNQKTGKDAIFTIDLTTNPQKEQYKADLVVGEIPDHHKNPEDYALELEKIADQIADKLKTDTEPRVH
jgi:hypothetical protein